MFDAEIDGLNYLENQEIHHFHPNGWDNLQHTQSSVNHSSNRPHRSPNPVNLAGSLHDTPLSTFNGITLHTGVNPNEMDSFFSQHINAQSDKDWQLNDSTKYQKNGIPLNADQYIGNFTPSYIANNSLLKNSTISHIEGTISGIRNKRIGINTYLSTIKEDKYFNYRSIKNNLKRHAKLSYTLKSRSKKFSHNEIKKNIDLNRKNIVEWADGDEYFADSLLKYFDGL